nr:hypothetical protein [Micromonospora viridifaciens]
MHGDQVALAVAVEIPETQETNIVAPPAADLHAAANTAAAVTVEAIKAVVFNVYPDEVGVTVTVQIARPR